MPSELTVWRHKRDAPLEPGRASSGELRASVVDPGDESGHLYVSLREWPAAERTAEHHHDGDLMLQVLEGRLLVVAAQGQHILSAGELVHVPAGLRHHEEALEASRFLVIAATPFTYVGGVEP